MSKEKDNNPFSRLKFPIVKNVKPNLISDDIVPKTAEEVREELGNVFKEILKETGKIVRCEDPMVCLRGCSVHEQSCRHPIYEHKNKNRLNVAIKPKQR